MLSFWVQWGYLHRFKYWFLCALWVGKALSCIAEALKRMRVILAWRAHLRKWFVRLKIRCYVDCFKLAASPAIYGCRLLILSLAPHHQIFPLLGAVDKIPLLSRDRLLCYHQVTLGWFHAIVKIQVASWHFMINVVRGNIWHHNTWTTVLERLLHHLLWLCIQLRITNY